MKLSLSTLDPDVNSVEEYLSSLSENDFSDLLEIASSDMSEISDDQLADIMTLSLNIFSTELDINPMQVSENTEMLNTIIKRFLSTVVIYSLMKKGIVEKTEDEDMTLYKDVSFQNTEKGMMIAENL